MSQESLLPGLDPDDLLVEAKERWEPIKTFCLFSGGNDSGVLAHRCRDSYDELFFIDTGVCVPTLITPRGNRIEGVEDFVRRYAGWIGKPVRILRSGDAYRRMVLGDDLWWERFASARRYAPSLSIEGMIAWDKEHARQKGQRVLAEIYGEAPHGFPGKGHHWKAFSRLKERRIEEMRRLTKQGHPRSAAVLFVSGIRRDESHRRKGLEPLTWSGSSKFVNPLIDWTNGQMRDYREEHDIPESDAARILCRSGECNCGAFAKVESERWMLESFWPEWWNATIRPLEEEAERRGIRWCRWGGFDLEGNQAAGEEENDDEGDEVRGPFLCANCNSRQLAIA